MEFMRNWILSVTVSAMIVAVAESMMPPGTVKKVAKLTGGLVLMLGILQPIVRMDYEELFLAANGFPSISVEEQETPKTGNEEIIKSIIEEELSAYVLDKAKKLGCSCEVEFRCVPGESGTPIPEAVVVRGLLAESQRRAMEALLAEDLGIPKDHQTYINEEVT